MPGEYLIGRDHDCHIRVDSPEVSQRHARFVIGDAEMRLEDLGSSNGCFVDNIRVKELIRLRPPQQIKLGTVGMPLRTLLLASTLVTNISPLEGMPLSTLWLWETSVRDLTPLKGAPLEQLWLQGTPGDAT